MGRWGTLAPAFVGGLVAVIPLVVPKRGLVACGRAGWLREDDWRS